MALSPGLTPSQTVGPFFGFALFERVGNELVAPDAPGAITIAGMVLDGNGDVRAGEAPTADELEALRALKVAGAEDGA